MKTTVWIAAFVTLLTGRSWGGNPNPRLVKDIGYQTESSSPGSFFAVGNILYFTVGDGVGRQLWKSDGTATGTAPVKSGFTGITEYETVGTVVFFSAHDNVNGPGLWKTNGTAAGTVLMKGGWHASSAPRYLTSFNGSVYFRAGIDSIGSLWKSNGTASGTVEVKANWNSHPASLMVLGNTLYFQATEQATGAELWNSNGTAAGTLLFKDVIPGSGSSYAVPMWPTGSSFFFVTNATSQLWKIEGTGAGMVDLGASPVDGVLRSWAMAGNTLFYAREDAAHGEELWKSDGTAAGTVMVKDIVPGPVDAEPLSITAVGNIVYFSAPTPATGHELWKSDGTEPGTVMLKDLVPGQDSSNPGLFTAVGDMVYFVASDPTNTSSKLWKTDGTPAGTVIVADYAVSPGFFAQRPVVAGTRLFYSPLTPEYGAELWALALQPPVPGPLTVTPSGTGSVNLHTTVNPNGLSTYAYIQYGPTTAYGSTITVSLVPDDGTSAQEVTATIMGLVPDSEYHCRLVAVNESGTACTADVVFTAITLTPVQSWRQSHFGTVDNAGAASDDADPDGDGQFNRLEYLAGTDPMQRTSALIFDVAGPPAAPGSLRLQPVRAGVRYIVQVSEDDLATWNDWPALQYDFPFDEIILTDPAGLPESHRFYRLRLEEIQ